MAATFQELMDRRTCDVTINGPTYSRTYQVIGDANARITEVAALAVVKTSTGSPTISGAPFDIGDVHPSDSDVSITSINIFDKSNNQRGSVMEVVIVWEPKATTIPASVRWGTEVYQEDIDTDLSTTPLPLRNSAGDPFPENPQTEKAYTTLEWTKNVTRSWFNSNIFTLMNNYGAVVNSTSYTVYSGATAIATFAAKTTKVEIKDAEYNQEGDYYRLSLLITSRNGRPGSESDGWEERILDQGNYCYDLGGDYVPMMDDEGLPMDTPQYLDGAGLRGTTPFYLGPFKFQKQVDVSGIFV